MFTALNSSQFNDSRTERHLGASFSSAGSTHNHSARISNPDPHRDEPLVETPTSLRDRGFLGVTLLSPRIAFPRRTRDNGPTTRSEMVHPIAHKQPQLVEHDVHTVVKMMLDQMLGRLANDGRIEIRGFGFFTVRFRRARVERYPRTGAPVSLPARDTVYFRPGTKLLERVDRESRRSAQVHQHAGGPEDPQFNSHQCSEIDGRDER